MVDISVFLAQLLAVVFFVLGISLFVAPAWYRAITDDILNSSSMMHLGSFLSLVMGLALVMVHNIREWSGFVIVTLFGWANIIKAIIPLWFPDWTVRMTKKLPMDPLFVRIGGVCMIVCALLLSMAGFGW